MSDDVRLLRHESGHGFQFFLNRGQEVPEYLAGTYEVAEIPSMTFELLTTPWNSLFFNQDQLHHYNFIQIIGGPQTLPYATAIDEFQHLVYGNPEMSPEERNAVWKSLEAKYMPTRDYEGPPYLERGTFWHQQAHVFVSPFYYIDYVFASICALQFWLKSQEHPKEVWDSFMHLCKRGGSRPFLTLLSEADLMSPFDEACLPTLIDGLKAWLKLWERDELALEKHSQETTVNG